MAARQVLFGDPWFGAWLTCAFMAAALVWAIRSLAASHDLGPAENAGLLEYDKGRKIWLFPPDINFMRLDLYGESMSFLDNLENNLKALESQEEKDPEKVKRDQERREADRNAALLRAPHVEALRSSAFTSQLLTECRAIGHGQRVLVQFAWIGETLRLTAKNKRLELIPSSEGIAAVMSVDGGETARATVDPHKDDAAALGRRWLTGAS